MGKYSIDAFEVHPLVKLRPVTAKPGTTSFQLLELHQAELEKQESAVSQQPCRMA